VHAPALIVGTVLHHRLRPAENRFEYPVFCLRLPLSGLEQVGREALAVDRAGLVAFHTRDHGARDGSPLGPWIARRLAEHGVAADGEVVLYAFPRVLGFVFNPVSFWVCHDRAGAVRAVLAEVNNTFGERHNYLLADEEGRPLSSGATLEARKAFHVSPFCRVEGGYRFRFHFGDDRWLARIDYADADGELLHTSIAGRAQPLTRAALRRAFLRQPLLTAGVVGRIHYQALRLWWKRVPFFAKPHPPLEETTR
jgi:DUF1365 family protein